MPPPPANVAVPLVFPEVSGISPTTLPVHIRRRQQRHTAAFIGEIAQPLVYGRALAEEEIAALANPAIPPAAKDCVIALDAAHRAANAIPNRVLPRLPATIVGDVQIKPATAALPLEAFVFDGKSWLEIAHDPLLSGKKGLTLAAWVKPAGSPAYGQRIIDKCPVGVDRGWRLDTHPANSLRLFGNGGLSFPAKLPVGRWTHVAATVDGKRGKQVLYVDGKPVAEQ